MDTAGAAEELSTASEYQRKAGRRAACLGLVIIIVIAVVLITVGHYSLHTPHTVLTPIVSVAMAVAVLLLRLLLW